MYIDNHQIIQKIEQEPFCSSVFEICSEFAVPIMPRIGVIECPIMPRNHEICAESPFLSNRREDRESLSNMGVHSQQTIQKIKQKPLFPFIYEICSKFAKCPIMPNLSKLFREKNIIDHQ